MGDRRMRQPPGVPGLGPEPAQRSGVVGQFGPQQLDRHRAGQHGVLGLPDLAGPAGSDLAVQAVAVGQQR